MAVYSDYTDHQLIHLLKNGDERAFTHLFDRYSPLLLSIAAKKVNSIDDAEDAVQEVFIRLWKHRTELRLVGNTRGYLYRAVINQVLNQYRNAKVKDEHIESFQLFLDSSTDTTDFRVRERFLNELIEKEISALPDKMAEVFRLRRNQQLTNREIADQLGISEQTVETHIKRALKVLRSRLAVVVFLLELLS